MPYICNIWPWHLIYMYKRNGQLCIYKYSWFYLTLHTLQIGKSSRMAGDNNAPPPPPDRVALWISWSGILIRPASSALRCLVGQNFLFTQPLCKQPLSDPHFKANSDSNKPQNINRNMILWDVHVRMLKCFFGMTAWAVWIMKFWTLIHMASPRLSWLWELCYQVGLYTRLIGFVNNAVSVFNSHNRIRVVLTMQKPFPLSKLLKYIYLKKADIWLVCFPY